jgi:hypothetical protein
VGVHVLERDQQRPHVAAGLHVVADAARRKSIEQASAQLSLKDHEQLRRGKERLHERDNMGVRSELAQQLGLARLRPQVTVVISEDDLDGSEVARRASHEAHFAEGASPQRAHVGVVAPERVLGARAL